MKRTRFKMKFKAQPAVSNQREAEDVEGKLVNQRKLQKPMKILKVIRVKKCKAEVEADEEEVLDQKPELPFVSLKSSRKNLKNRKSLITLTSNHEATPEEYKKIKILERTTMNIELNIQLVKMMTRVY
jgi:hypothetical protein